MHMGPHVGAHGGVAAILGRDLGWMRTALTEVWVHIGCPLGPWLGFPWPMVWVHMGLPHASGLGRRWDVTVSPAAYVSGVTSPQNGASSVYALWRVVLDLRVGRDTF
jgi:hypothetical protein